MQALNNNYPIQKAGYVIIIQPYQYKAKELPHDLVASGLNPIRVIAIAYVKNILPIKIADTVNLSQGSKSVSRNG